MPRRKDEGEHAPKPEPEFCNMCKISFPDFNALHAHKLESKDHNTCPVCSNDFRTRQGVKKHYVAMHAHEQDLPCPGCRVRFNRVGGLVSHIEMNQCPAISGDKFGHLREVKTEWHMNRGNARVFAQYGAGFENLAEGTEAGIFDRAGNDGHQHHPSANPQVPRAGGAHAARPTWDDPPDQNGGDSVHRQDEDLLVFGSPKRRDGWADSDGEDEPSNNSYQSRRSKGVQAQPPADDDFDLIFDAWDLQQRRTQEMEKTAAERDIWNDNWATRGMEAEAAKEKKSAEEKNALGHPSLPIEKRSQAPMTNVMISKNNATTASQDTQRKSLAGQKAHIYSSAPISKKPDVPTSNIVVPKYNAWGTSWNTLEINGQPEQQKNIDPLIAAQKKPNAPESNIVVPKNTTWNASWDITGTKLQVEKPENISPFQPTSKLTIGELRRTTMAAKDDVWAASWNTQEKEAEAKQQENVNPFKPTIADMAPDAATTVPEEDVWADQFGDGPPRMILAAQRDRLQFKAPEVKDDEEWLEYDPSNPKFNAEKYWVQITEKYKCPYPGCKKSLVSKSSLIHHLRSAAHMDAKLQCTNCLRYFGSATALVQHSESQANRCDIRETAQYAAALDVATAGTAAPAGRHNDDTIRYVANDVSGTGALVGGSQRFIEAHRHAQAVYYAERKDYWNKKQIDW